MMQYEFSFTRAILTKYKCLNIFDFNISRQNQMIRNSYLEAYFHIVLCNSALYFLFLFQPSSEEIRNEASFL